MGARTGGVHSPGKETGERTLIHFVKEIEPRGILTLIELGHPSIPEVVLLVSFITEHGFQKTGNILRPVFPPVEAFGILCRRGGLVIIFEDCPLSLGVWQIAWPDMKQETLVRLPLDIGFAPQGIDPAASNTHIAEKGLNDAHGANVLHPYCVLAPAHGI